MVLRLWNLLVYLIQKLFVNYRGTKELEEFLLHVLEIERKEKIQADFTSEKLEVTAAAAQQLEAQKATLMKEAEAQKTALQSELEAAKAAIAMLTLRDRFGA